MHTSFWLSAASTCNTLANPSCLLMAMMAVGCLGLAMRMAPLPSGRGNHFSYLFPPSALSKSATRNFFSHGTRGMALTHPAPPRCCQKVWPNDTNKQIPLYTVYQLYVGCSSATWDDFQRKCATKDATPIFSKAFVSASGFGFGCQEAWTFQISTIAIGIQLKQSPCTQVSAKHPFSYMHFSFVPQ